MMSNWNHDGNEVIAGCGVVGIARDELSAKVLANMHNVAIANLQHEYQRERQRSMRRRRALKEANRYIQKIKAAQNAEARNE